MKKRVAPTDGLPEDAAQQRTPTLAELGGTLYEVAPAQAGTPTSHVIIGDLSGPQKFVLLKASDGRTILAAISLEMLNWHREIVASVRSEYGVECVVRGGGYLRSHDGAVTIEGSSESYGTAPTGEVKALLKRALPGAEVRVVTATDRALIEAERKLRSFLEELPSEFHREFYRSVLDQAPCYAHGSTSRPVDVAGVPGLALMTYAAENGGSFGFDTIYLGAARKDGGVDAHPIARERWWTHLQSARLDDDGNVILAYESQGRTEEIRLSREQLSHPPMRDGLNDIDRMLAEMYEKTRAIVGKLPLFTSHSHGSAG